MQRQCWILQGTQDHLHSKPTTPIWHTRRINGELNFEGNEGNILLYKIICSHDLIRDHICMILVDNSLIALTNYCMHSSLSVLELSVGKQAAFEVFLRDHEDRLTIEDNRAVLQQRSVCATVSGSYPDCLVI